MQNFLDIATNSEINCSLFGSKKEKNKMTIACVNIYY